MRSIFLALMAAGTVWAFDVASAVADARQRAASMRFDLNVTQSGRIKKEIARAMESYGAMKPRIEAWKSVMHESNGTVVVDPQPAGQAVRRTEEPKPDAVRRGGRIYLFMSSSVPVRTWREYARSIDDLNLSRNVVMVLRGCIGGCVKIRPTIDFIHDVLSDGGKRGKGWRVQVWIDPLLFRRYGIGRVPAALYAKGLRLKDPTLGEGIESNIGAKPTVYRSEGDWSLGHHIRQLAKKSKDPWLEKVADSLEHERFYR